MPSIYPKRGYLWLSWYEKGRREQHPIIDPATGGKLKDTRENRRYARNIILSKTLELKTPRTETISLDLAIEKFLHHLIVNKDTYSDYKKRLYDFRNEIGIKEIQSINQDDITKFDKLLRERRIIKRVNKKEKELMPLRETTIIDYWRDIYSFFKYCQECGWIKKIPFERKKRVKRIEPIKKVIPLVLMKKLFDEIKNNEKHYRTLKLLALTGLRPIEAAALTWEKIDFNNNVIMVDNSKARREDLIPLSGNRFSDAMREFLLSFRQDSGKVLGYKNENGFRHINDRLQKIIGRQYTIYDLRRTFCTNLLLSGVDIKSVQKIMRHKDPNTTLRHYAYVELLRAGNELEKLPNEYLLF